MIKGFDFYKNSFGLQTSSEIHLGLERIETFLAGIGNPQCELKAVHIAGTNGKGSTLQFIRNILAEAGYSVGTFTSPYLYDVTDQISTLEGPIPVDDLQRTLGLLVSESGKDNIEKLTDFELLTVLAIVYFARVNTQEIVIFETGMGGLTDSTNVLTSMVSVITNISLEHTAFLGDSIPEIALQKAGIIKEGKPSIIGVRNEEALAVIRAYAKHQHARALVLDEDFFIVEEKGAFTVKTGDGQYNDLVSGLKGRYQFENAAIAVMAAQVLASEYDYCIKECHVAAGIKKTKWPARFEIISEKPTMILDGAHNPDAVKHLVDTFKTEYPGKKCKVLFGALKDKKANLMIEILEQISDEFIFADFDFPRAASARELAQACRKERKFVVKDLRESVPEIIENLQTEDILLMTGSLYFVSEVRRSLLE